MSLAVENYLTLKGCLGIIEGTDVEPSRAEDKARTVRAGSVPPTEKKMDDDAKGDWEEWRKREACAQGVIKSSVDAGFLVDIRDLFSAKDMCGLSG
ncbi:hypothetical protein L198_00159 [Cryptococcus wingfieldii CBS 7118]|uniref:Uncharacterized protein n=1 Tax=Cryptococcus wingfieldii CBS 7118 TaxID=1295528 RepID=A0A1E3K5R6_9TREE|nr:hypothetical protein L198_00159 [Cryptococcus wingfieldii CBS 7118]ODO08429.1 hypothetical protein L198_00159 [Cryptococcus wingfieldii CBS 7118]